MSRKIGSPKAYMISTSRAQVLRTSTRALPNQHHPLPSMERNSQNHPARLHRSLPQSLPQLMEGLPPLWKVVLLRYQRFCVHHS
eukprot:scaffold17886_cov179-Skeletonema_dohrnii-CCMP3373.AAC.1